MQKVGASVLRAIIRHQLKGIVLTPKFLILFALCSVLTFMVFTLGAASYRTARVDYDAAIGENYNQFAKLTEWRRVWGTRVLFPPLPLSTLVSGISSDLERVVEVRGKGPLNTENSRYGEEPVAATFRLLDLEFLFGTALPLFAILLCFDVVAGEKEQGTLRLVFSNAVPRNHFLLGKGIGAALAICGPVLLLLSLGALLLPLLGVPLSLQDWGKLALIVISGILYLLFFIALSLLISSLNRSSANALLILLITWIAIVHVLPKLAVTTVAESIEVPSLDEISRQRISLATQLRSEEFRELGSFRPSAQWNAEQILTQFNALSDSLASVREDAVYSLASNLERDRFNRQVHQAKLSLALARLSPHTSFTLAITSIGGTDLAMKHRFMEQVRTYQITLGTFLKQKIGASTNDVAGLPRVGTGAIDPTEIPRFELTPVEFGEAVTRALPEIVILVAFVCLSLICAFLTFAKYDLR